MIEYTLTVNGFCVRAAFREETVTDVFLPLLRKLTALRRERGGRLVVFLAGPPGAGKSTLAAFLEELSREARGLEPLQALGVDGFHFHRDHILSHTVRRGGAELPMADVKGCPESYDVQKLREALRELRERDTRWPLYDRRLHDPVESAVEAKGPVVLVEGNWLLLRGGPWAGLREFCGYSVFLSAGEADVKGRLIERKMRGGLTRPQAERFYENSDGPNVRLCLEGSAPADMVLRLAPDGEYTAISGR